MPVIAGPLKLRLTNCPPSANRMWRKFRGHMVKSAEAKSWETAALLEIASQARNLSLPVPGYWQAQVHIPRRSGVDLDNFIKPVIDALHRAGVTPDDRYLVSLSAKFWGGDHIVIYVRHERTSAWQAVMKTTKDMIRRMRKASALIPES